MAVARIAVVPGDGIGIEVVAQARQGPRRGRCPAWTRPRTTSAPPGTTAPVRCCPTPSLTSWPATTRSCSGAAARRPALPPGVLERGLLLKLRFDFDQYVNLRPSRLWPGTSGPLGNVKPGEIDLIVVREGHRGPVHRAPAATMHQGTPAEVATEESLNTRHGVERVIRDAFARASSARAAQGDAGAQDQRAHPRRWPVGPHLRRGRGRVPGDQHRVPARRRGRHVPRDATAALRRGRHRQPVRRHPHRHRRGRHRWHRAGRERLHQPGAGSTRRCSSRSTARRPTSPARASPTRWPPCCRWRCCWTTSATPRSRAGSSSRGGRRRAGRPHRRGARCVPPRSATDSPPWPGSGRTHRRPARDGRSRSRMSCTGRWRRDRDHSR